MKISWLAWVGMDGGGQHGPAPPPGRAVQLGRSPAPAAAAADSRKPTACCASPARCTQVFMFSSRRPREEAAFVRIVTDAGANLTGGCMHTPPHRCGLPARALAPPSCPPPAAQLLLPRQHPGLMPQRI